jgi:hypothetical protein
LVGAVVVATVLGALTTTAVGAAPTTTPPPVGNRTVVIKKARFRIAVPNAWVTLDLTRQPLSYYVEALASSHPNLSDFYASSNFAPANDAGLPYTDLLAADASTDALEPDNVTIEHYRQSGSPIDHQRELRDVLVRTGFDNVKVASTRISGRPGVLVVGYHGGTSPIYEASYFVVAGSNTWYVAAFITQHDPRQDPAVQVMIHSFTVTS